MSSTTPVTKLFYTPVWNADSFPSTDHEFYKKYGHITKLVIQKLSTQTLLPNDAAMQKVAESSMKILQLLQAWPKDKPQPKALIKTACCAYGQLAYASPYSLPAFDEAFLPFLKKSDITVQHMNTFYWKFSFGPLFDRESVDEKQLRCSLSGEHYIEKYKLNYPVYFHQRLLGEFTGQNLLVGGGENCECGKANILHPKEAWYSVDIDKTSQPDLIIHAGYKSHLNFFPYARFQTIWFEHAQIASELLQKSIFQQYFRMLKPGGIMLYQSNFYSSDENDLISKMAKEATELLIKCVKKFEMQILEQKEKNFDFDRKYIQFIAMKPFLKKEVDFEMISIDPAGTIDFNQYRAPNQAEMWRALSQVKLETGQVKLIWSQALKDWYANNKGQIEKATSAIPIVN